MSDPIRINGNVHDWGSIVAKLLNEPWNGFTSISYGDSRESVKLYGMGKHQAPRGRTRGKYVTDPVVVKMPKGTAQLFIDALARQAPDGISYGDVEFDFQVQFIASETPITVLIKRCKVIKDTSSHEEGGDPLFDELTFDCMQITRNGKTLFDSSTGAP